MQVVLISVNIASRNYVFVQRGIRAVKLWQITVGVCLHIDMCHLHW